MIRIIGLTGRSIHFDNTRHRKIRFGQGRGSNTSKWKMRKRTQEKRTNTQHFVTREKPGKTTVSSSDHVQCGARFTNCHVMLFIYSSDSQFVSGRKLES